MSHTDPSRRHDFVLLFDVTDGNPNGDPDAGNLLRTDPETMQGIVTDVCLKRKVRDYVIVASDSKVYVEHKGVALNTQNRRAFAGIDVDPKKATPPDRQSAREWMCANFYDVRMFGAVLSTGQKEGLNAGQPARCADLYNSRSPAASTRSCPRTSRLRAWRLLAKRIARTKRPKWAGRP